MSTSQAASSTARIGSVLHPVGDVAAAVEYYGSVFGLPVRFVDGTRYAALEAGGTTLALAAAGENLTGGVAAAMKVDDLDAALRALVDAGGVIVREPERGRHEVRAVVRDPWSNVMVVYSAR